MSTENQLTACPFAKCGGMASFDVNDETYTVYCMLCGIQSPVHFSEKDAREWWNARPEQSAELTAVIEEMRGCDIGSWQSLVDSWADRLEAIAARSAREVAILSAADAYRLALVNRWNDPGDSATAIMLGRAESELLDHARSGAKEIMT